MSAHDGKNSDGGITPSSGQVVKPERLCAGNKTLTGDVTLKGMSRLLPMLASEEGGVSYRLEFSYSSSKKMQIFGEVNATLYAQCQRCSQATKLQLHSTPQIQLVGSEAEAKVVDEEFDPVLAPENGLSITGLLEEELIVGMPLIPKCEQECSVQIEYGVDTDEASTQPQVESEPHEEKRDNPFDILAQLKRDK